MSDKAIQNKWQLLVQRRVVVFRAFIMAEGTFRNLREYLGVAGDTLVATENELSSYYLALSDLEMIADGVIRRLHEDASFSDTHISDCLCVCESMIVAAQRSGKVTQKMSKEFSYAFEHYVTAYHKFVPFVIIPVAIEKRLTKNLSDYIKEKAGREDYQTLITRLTTPDRLPETSLEQEELLRLALRVISKSIDPREALQVHYKKYCWLSCYNIDESPFPLSYFERRMTELVQLGARALQQLLTEAESKQKTDERHYRETVKKLGIQDKLLHQLQLLRRYVWLRSYRIEMQSKANFFVRPLFQAIAKQHRLALSEVCALSPDEIRGLILGSQAINTQTLNERMKSYVLVTEGGISSLTYGSSGRTVALEMVGEREKSIDKQVTGMSAYKGKVSGKVRVLISKKDISLFKSGEILVTTMTSPEFVPAMRKASAIVTNEGGVLCHAAIMAREFKIPCVIGTADATTVFKNGDLVEVDGDAGIVRSIL